MNDAANQFLTELSINILNFKRKSFDKYLYTYFLDGYGCSMFGLEIVQQQAFLGLPQKLHRIAQSMSFVDISIVDDIAGLFIVFVLGQEEGKHACALHLNLSKMKITALKSLKSIKILGMDSQGRQTSKPSECIVLPVKLKQRLEWEFSE